MSQMRAAGPAANLYAVHPVARVRLQFDGIAVDRLVEAGPPASRLELCIGAEERGATRAAAIGAVIVTVDVPAREGSLCRRLPQDGVPVRGKLLTPFLF